MLPQYPGALRARRAWRAARSRKPLPRVKIESEILFF
jgi:hypothetical protein